MSDIVELVRGLRSVCVPQLTAVQARQAVSHIVAVRSWLDAFEAQVVSQLVAVQGEALAAVDLGATGRMSSGQVGKAVGRASALEEMPMFAGALSDAQVTAEHVDSLARGLRALGENAELLAEKQGVVLAQARHMNPQQFKKYIANQVEQLSEARADQEFVEQQRKTYLRFNSDSNGMVRLNGVFDPERGAMLMAHVNAEVERMFHGDQIVEPAPGVDANDHRRGVALVNLVAAERAGARAQHQNTEVVVLIDLETLSNGAHKDSVRRSRDGVQLPVSVIRRMACEAGIVPMVLNGDGVVVDIGREKRLATRKQRQAIMAMHDTCAMPECGVGVAVCVPHHIQYWENGGTTDLSNLVPLCSRHHHAVHEGGWKLSMDKSRTVTVVVPDGRVLTRSLRCRC